MRPTLLTPMYGDGVEGRSERDERILGGEVRLLRARNGPCMVCGHPTGDCAGEISEHVRVVGAEVFPSLQREDVFIVQENVYEERAISPFTTARVLAAAKGTAISIDRAKELGLL